MTTPETPDGQAVRSTPLLDRILVWWSNWKNRRVAKAYRTMAEALRRDPSFAESWRANIACVVHDTPASQTAWETANETADRLMAHLWGVRSNKVLTGKAPSGDAKPEVKGN